jgi:hypothetical protein
MTKHNPAYLDKTYIAVATPAPGEENHIPGKPIPRIASTPRAVQSPVTPSVTVDRPRRAAAVAPSASTPVPSRLRQSAAPEVDDNPEFDGKTFQQAQEQILKEIVEYVEPQ